MNTTPFLAKESFNYYPIGSRENYTSGIVEIEGFTEEGYYLGFSSATVSYGIHLAIQVVAVTKENQLVMTE